MKKLLVLIFVITMLCGCSKKEEIDMTDEVIKYIDIYYRTSVDNKAMYGVEIDFSAEDVHAEYKEYETEVAVSIAINDVDLITDFIKSNISEEENKKKRGNGSEDERQILWRISILTEDNRYSFSDFDEYPAYWEDLWTMLVEATAAESISDFGFETK